MRKIKAQLTLKLPSWHYCNYDGFTANDRYSKDLCRFCEKTRYGHRCRLFDSDLMADPRFVHKAAECIRLCDGEYVEEAPPAPEVVDVKLLSKEMLKEFVKRRTELQKQGYPFALAEKAAAKYVLGEK